MSSAYATAAAPACAAAPSACAAAAASASASGNDLRKHWDAEIDDRLRKTAPKDG